MKILICLAVAVVAVGVLPCKARGASFDSVKWGSGGFIVTVSSPCRMVLVRYAQEEAYANRNTTRGIIGWKKGTLTFPKSGTFLVPVDLSKAKVGTKYRAKLVNHSDGNKYQVSIRYSGVANTPQPGRRQPNPRIGTTSPPLTAIEEKIYLDTQRDNDKAFATRMAESIRIIARMPPNSARLSSAQKAELTKAPKAAQSALVYKPTHRQALALMVKINGLLQGGETSTPYSTSLSESGYMKIFSENAPEFAYIKRGNFKRYGLKKDGSHDLLDERWTFRKGERFFIAFTFPKQLYGMSGSMQVKDGNKLIGSVPIGVIRKGRDMLGQRFHATLSPGIYTVEWRLGKGGNPKLAAIQLFRIRK